MWIDAVAGALLVSSVQVLMPAAFSCRAMPVDIEVGCSQSVTATSSKGPATSSK